MEASLAEDALSSDDEQFDDRFAAFPDGRVAEGAVCGSHCPSPPVLPVSPGVSSGDEG